MLDRCVFRLVQFLLKIVGYIYHPLNKWVFSHVYDGEAKMVSRVENPVLLHSAIQLARKIRTRELKAEHVMESHIARVTEVAPLLNAVIADRFSDALSEARQLDKDLDENPNAEKFSEQNQPFLGVPLSVKEAFFVKGMPNASGLLERKDCQSEEDCPVVTYMRKAGAIPFCITNVSELCMWYESANRLYGRTRNPYNTARIVGGSSGGEACNIASGGALIGLGSDIGGSIRMPSFFNGIYGHKPSRGAVTNDGQFPAPTGKENDMLSTGPMCRYVDDLLPMMKVLVGPNNKQLKLDTEVDVSKLKVFSVVDDGGSLLCSEVDPQLKQAQLKAVQFLIDHAGINVKTISIPKLKHSLEMWTAKMVTSGGTPFSVYMGNQERKVNCFKELLKWLVGWSNHTLPAIALGLGEELDFLLQGGNEKALQALEKLENELQDLLGNDGVLLYPSHPKIAPYHNQPILYPFNYAYTGIFNALGLPVTQVPLGLSKEGLPLGVQVVSTINNDHLTLAVAKELSKGVAGWVNPGTKSAS